MSTNQSTHGSSTDSSVTVLDNLVNANSVDDVYIYRGGDQLAVSTPVQTAEFHLDQLVCIYEGQMDVFEQVFESRGEIHDFWWTQQGFAMVIHDGIERHQVQFIVNIDSARAGDTR